MILLSSIFSGGRLKKLEEGWTGRDIFLPFAGLAGTGGGGIEGGGPGKVIGERVRFMGGGGRERGGGGRDGGLLAMFVFFSPSWL